MFVVFHIEIGDANICTQILLVIKVCVWGTVIDRSLIQGLFPPCAWCSHDRLWIYHDPALDKVVTQYE